MSSSHKIRYSKAILWDINSKHYKGSKIYKETTYHSIKFPNPIVFANAKFQKINFNPALLSNLENREHLKLSIALWLIATEITTLEQATEP